ncbi:hypothetical protein KP509_02G072400 [Ceratopteris richardii]|nr:hypothetical protein KP509_02G072400 [Ceratopteris richardii]
MLRQGHAKRNSLSRVWHQLGENLFCGSGHGEEMELRGLAPIPRTPSGTYFCSEVYDDTVMDESYWQSLADSILKERQKDSFVYGHSDHLVNEQNTKENKTDANDLSARSFSSSRHMNMANREQESESLVSEIISAPPDIETWRHDDACGWEESAVIEDSHAESIVPVQVRDGSTRLNTTLEASPVLAHNYSLSSKSRVGDSEASNSIAEVNHSSCPLPTPTNQVVEPELVHSTASSSNTISSSDSVTATHALEDTSRHVLETVVRVNEVDSQSVSSAPVSYTAVSSVEPSARPPPQLESANSARVSLMTLLHEEAAAVEIVDVPDVLEDSVSEQAQSEARQDEGLVGEEPLALLCCVCMVRRKGAALIPCGHTFCRLCSKQLFAGRGACPLCNNLIVQLLDIF